MKRIAMVIVALATIAGWSAVVLATPCVEGPNPPNPNNKVNLTDVEGVGPNQFTLTFANWPIVTTSSNACGAAVQLKTTVVASVDAVTWLETGTTNVVAVLGTGWAANGTVGTAAEAALPSDVGEAWFGFLNTSAGSAVAGDADLRVTVTLQGGQTAGDLINSLDKTGGKKFLFTDQTDITGIPQGVGQTQGTLPATNIAGPKGQLGCRRTIAKEASKFVSAKTKALQACEGDKVKGKHNDLCPNLKATQKIAKATTKFEAAIGKQCGGKDGVCGGDTTKEIGGGLAGRPATCPNFESGTCTNTIGIFTCTGIATCIECIGNAAVDQAIDLYYAGLEPTDPVLNVTLNKCQQAIGKTVSKFLLAKEKALQKCWDARLKGKHTGTCPDFAAASGSSPKKAADSIAKAEGKKIATICKACGGEEKLCDNAVTPVNPGTPIVAGSGGTGVDADFTADDILAGSGPFNCPSVSVPGGPSCGGVMVTLADVIFCLDCVTEYKVDCLDPNRVPETFAGYPIECN